jgi:hypothetical protein
MKGKRRAEADHTPRHELGRLGKRVVGIERRAGKLIKPAAELDHDALQLDTLGSAGQGPATRSDPRITPGNVPCGLHFLVPNDL